MTDVKSLDFQQRCTWQLFTADLVSAALAAALVSPWVKAIDAVIVHKTATGASWRSCIDWASKPRKPLIGSLFPALVYFGTYATANLFDSLYATANDLDDTTISSTAAKFLATTLISTSLGIYKDGYYAKIYGQLNRASPVPLLSYALFTGRDAITIFASFNIPALLAPHLAQLSFSDASPFSTLIGSEAASLKTSQMLIPALTQFITTPIHLLGLDLYNRPIPLGIRERLSSIRHHAPVAVPLRMMRVLPVFGIGNMANTVFRNSIMHGMN
ncbi:hypothetical protein B0T10DRAFT_557517 [Thelonectria olida]|uniref:Sequence orphan n=1 Tax=Thelonectria olida TaxID=1576542 RepID=A0A9P8WB30_9HYPO|nr:hypothetical protein B0T10DRAFT_557517 [Thelonectria olida]